MLSFNARNFLLYNVAWFACVHFAADDHAWVGIVATALVVTAHLLGVTHWRREAAVLAVAAAVGYAWESLLVGTGVLSYPTAPEFTGLAPLWIVALWVNFATTLDASLAWIRRSPWLAAVFGALGGPLAFLAGEKMGAVQFGETTTALTVLGVGWAVLLPAFCRIVDMLKPHDEPVSEPAGSALPRP